LHSGELAELDKSRRAASSLAGIDETGLDENPPEGTNCTPIFLKSQSRHAESSPAAADSSAALLIPGIQLHRDLQVNSDEWLE
jgi:hypothetical protein